MPSISNLRATSIWRYCANRKRRKGGRNEYIFLLRLCFNGRIDGDGDKQTELGQKIRFEKSFRRALFMALDSERREDIPFVHDVFYRVINPKAKSTISSSFPSSLSSLFLSLGPEKETEISRTRDLRYTFQAAPKLRSLG